MAGRGGAGERDIAAHLRVAKHRHLPAPRIAAQSLPTLLPHIASKCRAQKKHQHAPVWQTGIERHRCRIAPNHYTTSLPSHSGDAPPHSTVGAFHINLHLLTPLRAPSAMKHGARRLARITFSAMPRTAPHPLYLNILPSRCWPPFITPSAALLEQGLRHQRKKKKEKERGREERKQGKRTLAQTVLPPIRVQRHATLYTLYSLHTATRKGRKKAASNLHVSKGFLHLLGKTS